MPQLTAKPPEQDVDKAAEVEVRHKPSAHYPFSLPVLPDHHDINWSKLVIAFCFGSALEIAHHSQQYPHYQYLLLCFAISVSFSCVFVAMFIRSKFSMAARLLELVGILSAVTSFFLAITSPFPLCLKCTIWTLYGISLLAILICNLL